jgi:hypothetical protein
MPQSFFNASSSKDGKTNERPSLENARAKRKKAVPPRAMSVKLERIERMSASEIRHRLSARWVRAMALALPVKLGEG